ncbi:unnamed protein product, partial [Rotaria sordida]
AAQSNVTTLNSLHSNNVEKFVSEQSAINVYENFSSATAIQTFGISNLSYDDQIIARKYRFDLNGIKTFEKRLFNKDRMSKRMYAIICCTNITKEYVMLEICRQFPMPIIQYVCVSSDSPTSGLSNTNSSSVIYVQILLKRKVNKRGWFLDKVTGDFCNYHVTYKELPWHQFIKKDRFSIEIGHFQSRRPRANRCTLSFRNAPKRMDMDIIETVEIIDLCTPNFNTDEIILSPIVVHETIDLSKINERFPNIQRRLPVLPWFPTNNKQQNGYPLMSNIPPHKLNQEELIRRRSGTFKPAFNIVKNDSNIQSFICEKVYMYFGDLLERLKVDQSILDYNYTRLNKYMKMLACEQMRVFKLRAHEIQRIDENEYPIALEFFLQFDVNMFYMKTCSFRHARPRTLNEGLFCLQEPEARYELAACGNCALCYPQYDMKYRSKKSIIEFSQAHKYTFLNGYQAILNCSASCHTRNIIYALICPCGKFEYIGATTNSLHDRLIKHREHGNRIIHEFLIGQENILRDFPRGKLKEIIVKDRMKLYQHSTHCPVAMQIFLDANPQYWRFVPMTLKESERPEQKIVAPYTSTEELSWTIRSKEDTKLYVEAVPKPSYGFAFSNRQIMLQTQYFHKTRDQTLPNQHIDLYNATIVAVLPETCSDMFRFTIESLFITYAETNLNSIGNVLNTNRIGESYPTTNPWLVRGSEWCQGLLRRPEPKNTIAKNIIATK